MTNKTWGPREGVTLISTLGLTPAVLLETLIYLLTRGLNIRNVYIVRTSGKKLKL